MNNDPVPAVNRLSRVAGLGLLTIAFLTRAGTPTENHYFGIVGMLAAAWCLIELVRSYGKS